MVSRRLRVSFLACTSFMGLVLAWGYWHAWNHTDLWVNVYEHSAKSEAGPHVLPRGVTLTFWDKRHAPLAVARSVGPPSLILPVHPNTEIGNCQHAQLRPPAGNAAAGDYAACIEQYSAWCAKWATRVHSADVRVGSCEVRDVPVTVRVSISDWLLWWVPIVHIGGLPFEYVSLSIHIDSVTCVAGAPPNND